jgi:hypothetical protein
MYNKRPAVFAHQLGVQIRIMHLRGDIPANLDTDDIMVRALTLIYDNSLLSSLSRLSLAPNHCLPDRHE